MGDRTAGNAFDKRKRLLNQNDYRRVFEQTEARASHRHLLLLARRNGGAKNRLGLVIAKKHVRLAVTRNRIKRVTREFFRCLPASSPAMDVIVLARPGIGRLDNATLSSILQQQWQRLLGQACNHVSHNEQGT